ncbi:MAG: PD-(D/E)XK nuclease domain-containing protein [Clostridiales bacterium]|nr:PD-(D/E)XK nuclease domain-containing protein [Clostridiales bacterium]
MILIDRVRQCGHIIEVKYARSSQALKNRAQAGLQQIYNTDYDDYFSDPDIQTICHYGIAFHQKNVRLSIQFRPKNHNTPKKRLQSKHLQPLSMIKKGWEISAEYKEYIRNKVHNQENNISYSNAFFRGARSSPLCSSATSAVVSANSTYSFNFF